MFGWGSARQDPLADARAAERFVAAAAGGDTLATHEGICTVLRNALTPGTEFTPKRLAAVFVLDAHAAALHRALVAQYVGHGGRSAKIEKQIWTALFDLTQAFQATYQAFGTFAFADGTSPKWRPLLAPLIASHVVHLGRDARMRLYRYEAWIPGKWAELHALVARATSLQLDRQPVLLEPDAPATTIEHQYLMILVLLMVDCGTLTAAQIEALWAELDGWCASLRLSLASRVPTAFYVDLASREGLKRRPPGPLEGSVLFVDTQPLHAVLQQSQVTLAETARERPRSDEGKRAAQQLEVLKRFSAKVDPEFKPFPRSGERMPTKDHVDAITGLAKIAGYLRDEDRDPRYEAFVGKSFGGSLELATFGRIRNEQDRRAELARQRLAQYAAPGGPWEAKDVSSTGFRLIAPADEASLFAVGTLVAIRPFGNSQWILGIVRRLKRPTADRIEVGFQRVASEVAGVDLVEQRRGADTDYSVDGDGGMISGRSFVALFLVLRKPDGSVAAHSVMVPASEYHPGKRLTLVMSRGLYRVLLGGIMEQQPDWVWAAVEAQELGEQAAALGDESRR